MKHVYTIDPYVVSILFGIEDDRKVLFTYQQIMGAIADLSEQLMREHLQKNSVSEADISKAFEDDVELSEIEFENPKVLELLKDEELGRIIETATQVMLKSIYTAGLAKLTPEKKQELNEYLEGKDNLIKLDKDIVLQSVQALLEEGTAAQAASPKPQEQVKVEPVKAVEKKEMALPEIISAETDEKPEPEIHPQAVVPQPVVSSSPEPARQPESAPVIAGQSETANTVAKPEALSPAAPVAAQPPAVQEEPVGNRTINIVDQKLPQNNFLERDFAPKLSLGGQKGAQPLK